MVQAASYAKAAFTCRQRHRSSCSNFGWSVRGLWAFTVQHRSPPVMVLMVIQAQVVTELQLRTQLLTQAPTQVQQNDYQQRQN